MYDIFYISNEIDKSFIDLKEQFPTIKIAPDYATAKKRAFTKLFWVIPNNVLIDPNFDFSYKADEWSQDIVHVFKNGEFYDGVYLAPKKTNTTINEFNYRFFINKKEIDIIASNPVQYDRFFLQTYEDYLNALENTTTDMFWGIWNDIEINKDFDFNYHIPYYDAFHRSITHVFKNGEFYDGLCLFSSTHKVSKKELDYRFFTNKKEVNIVVSNPVQYDRIHVNDYNDYTLKLSTVNSEFVWVIPTDIEIEFNFNYQMPYWEKDIIHIFKNGQYNDGIFLQHRDCYISKHNYEYCWHTKKKEISILASKPKSYDIVFISYQEPNADENFENLKQRFADRVIHRVHGVKGIHQAHIEAAKTAKTDMFYVVDGDAYIVDEFKFDYQVPRWKKDNVFVWRSINPINDLVYGYGGIKLFPRKETIEMDMSTPDMTTSISSKFNAIPQISNITAFNTDPFNTWRSAFRECAKLASKTINRQDSVETNYRLDVWTTNHNNGDYSEYALAGAKAGKKFGLDNKTDISLINDFDWLQQFFQQVKI